MSLRRAFNLDGPEISLVQNRLNVAALALTVLVFSGSFTLSLFNSLHPPGGVDFRLQFLHILTPLAVGVIASLGSIACFLHSQHSEQSELIDGTGETTDLPHGRHWYNARRWWFCLGQILLYMALAEALSASLTELVYGISLSSNTLGILLGVVALPVWWIFLFLGPVMFLRRVWSFQSRTERIVLCGTYVVILAIVVSISALAYESRGGGGFLRNAFDQLYHPMTWHQRWAD